MFPAEDEFDKTICTCDCHANPSIKHFIACCHKCTKCDKRIMNGFAEDHKKVCSGESKNPESK